MMMLRTEIADGISQQAKHAAHNSAPGTGAVCRAMIALARGTTACGARITNWPGSVIKDAMPLRLAGGLHDLFRRGIEPQLGAVYRGELTDQATIDALVGEIVTRHDADLLPWFDGPPQTNEAGRSANFVAALHWLASRVVPMFEINEIGSSAGMNLLVDRYRYDLGGVVSGPADAPITIHPDWRGPPPPSDAFTITSVRGCDLTPIDVRSDSAADRLRAYIWPEMAERFARMDAGIAMIRERGVDLVQADAADWVEAQFALPQTLGVTRVLLHSIVWQYLPAEVQARITKAMETAAAATTPDRPLAWIAVETNRDTFQHELMVRHWPSSGEMALLGSSHAHGQWIEWRGDDITT
jgi:hypothetical protein